MKKLLKIQVLGMCFQISLLFTKTMVLADFLGKITAKLITD